MGKVICENDVEEMALGFLSNELGYEYAYAPDFAPDSENPERETYRDVVLVQRLRNAIAKLNPEIPETAREEALKKVLRSESPDLVVNNEKFHQFLVNGIDVEFRYKDRIKGDKVWLIDFENPENNEFLAVNQFTIIENDHNRRPDVILFVNGLPLVIFELKNPAKEDATISSAYEQLNTYKHQIPTIFQYNQILVISDGFEAKAGSITSGLQRFMSWKTIDGVKRISEKNPQLEVLIKGMMKKQVLLDLIKNFIVFEKNDKKIQKKIAAYHQYHAVVKAVETTKEATKEDGQRKCGVVWHTQGSGKSLTMLFYAGKLVLDLDNPTIVLLTDRNDLDNQLFEVFCNCENLLRQTPVQAESREHVKELLQVGSGGIIFTTIEKFYPDEKGADYPELSPRNNIVVIADEAHRTQYGFALKVDTIDKEKTAKLRYGYAKHLRDALPNASFIGFTGTPISFTDKNTRDVFGDYIDIYDIEQAVDDNATVPIYYESRIVKLEMKEGEDAKIDDEFENVTEGEEIDRKEKLKSKWSRLEKIVGSDTRIKQIAKDLVEHFETRNRDFDGKAMVVCMSRRICVELYNEITRLRPHWHNEDDDKGVVKVVMTGSASDKNEWQMHIRNKPKRKEIGEKFKDPEHSIKLVLVRDMWLTGFDVPCLTTMYIDKPMRGHNLLQAIARVNRVYKEKKGGLIVDYLGIAADLKEAMKDYTKSGGKGDTSIDIEEAIAVMLEKYEIICDMFHGFDYKRFFEVDTAEKLQIICDAVEHILAKDRNSVSESTEEKGKKQTSHREEFIITVTELLKAYALVLPRKEALKIRDDVGFFQAVKARVVKFVRTSSKTGEELDTAIKQIVSEAIVSKGVVDVFEAAGIKKPEISILSDAFLAEIRAMKHKNLALELLKKLLNDEIRIRTKNYLVQSRKFSMLLANAIKRYINKNIEAIEVIEELMKLAVEIREDFKRGDDKNLTDDELAFYDAVSENESAKELLGDETLSLIAVELVKTIRNSVTIDWTIKESVRKKIKVRVKRILRKFGYPPDKTKAATDLVLEQATLLCKNWAESA